MPEKATTDIHIDTPDMAPQEMMVTIGDGPGFPALVDLDERWNGWLIPRFDRATASRVVEWLNQERTTAPEDDRHEYAHATWMDNAIVITNHDDPDPPDRIEPDTEGRYAIGAYNWCWEPIDQHQDRTTATDQPIKITTLTALQVSALRELQLTDRQATIGATVATFHMPARDALTLVITGQQELGLAQGTTRHPYKSLHGIVRKLRKLSQPTGNSGSDER